MPRRRRVQQPPTPPPEEEVVREPSLEPAGADAEQSPPPSPGEPDDPREPVEEPPSTRVAVGPVVLCAVVAFACFANTLDAGFTLDDSAAVQQNRDARAERPLSQAFVSDYWGAPMGGSRTTNSYRPLTVLSFRANFLAAGFEPFWYHLVNVVLHAVGTGLFVVLCQLWSGGDALLSAVAGLLFATHPIHTEAVANIAGRAELLCFVALVAALLCYRQAALRTRTRALWLVLALAMVVVSTLCKEVGLMALAIFAGYDWMCVHGAGLDVCALGRTFWARLLVLVATGGGMLYLRYLLIGKGVFLALTLTLIDAPFSHVEGTERYLGFAWLHTYYTYLLLWPAKLSADYSYNCIPQVLSLEDPRNAVSAGMYASLGVLGLTAMARRWRLVTMALVLLLMPYVPASNYFFPVGTVIGERLMYVPSSGFVLFVAVAFCWAVRRWPWAARLLYTLLGLVLIVYTGRSVVRNRDWHDNKALFASAAEVCPQSAKVWYVIGTQQSDPDLELEYYRKAIAITPDYGPAQWRLGFQLFRKDPSKIDEPLEHLYRAIDLKVLEANHDVGVIMAGHRNYTTAAHHLERCVRLRPTFASAHCNLGSVYVAVGHAAEALPHFERAIELRPDQLAYYSNYAIALKKAGQEERARAVLRETLRMAPGYEPAIKNLEIIDGRRRGALSTQWVMNDKGRG